ncbi:hypothetical protein JOM56_013711 [Amanita muscaria]
MTIYRRWRSLAWEMESNELKAEINALWNEKNTPEGNAPDNDGDENEAQVEFKKSFQGSVDELGEAVTSFLRELHEETGWAFTVLGGGLNHEGEVKMVVTHVGKTTSGKTFPHICDKYQENVLQEYLNFVNIRHHSYHVLYQYDSKCKKTPTSQDTEAPGTRGDGGSQTTPTNKGKRGQKKCDNKDGSAIPEDVTENTTSMTAPKNAAEHSQTTDERLASPIPPSDRSTAEAGMLSANRVDLSAKDRNEVQVLSLRSQSSFIFPGGTNFPQGGGLASSFPPNTHASFTSAVTPATAMPQSFGYSIIISGGY